MSHALRRFAVSVVAAVVPVAAVVAPAGGDPRPWYVALGDSYSSGVGAEPYPPGACQRSDGAYAPRFTRSSAGAGYDLVFVACSGAETRHVVSEGQREAGVRHPQIQKVRDLAEFVRLVTITIGGNDARFGEILHACVTGFRSCTVTYGPGGERGDQGEWIERVVRPRLVQTYRARRPRRPGRRPHLPADLPGPAGLRARRRHRPGREGVDPGSDHPSQQRHQHGGPPGRPRRRRRGGGRRQARDLHRRPLRRGHQRAGHVPPQRQGLRADGPHTAGRAVLTRLPGPTPPLSCRTTSMPSPTFPTTCRRPPSASPPPKPASYGCGRSSSLRPKR